MVEEREKLKCVSNEEIKPKKMSIAQDQSRNTIPLAWKYTTSKETPPQKPKPVLQVIPKPTPQAISKPKPKLLTYLWEFEADI